MGWDKRRFKFLRDRADPKTGALTQLLAHSCNMDPPKVGEAGGHSEMAADTIVRGRPTYSWLLGRSLPSVLAWPVCCQGFSRMDEWAHYGPSTIRFLAETLVASRKHLVLTDSALGHVAWGALTAGQQQ